MAAEMEFCFYYRPTSTADKLNKILTSSNQSPQDDYCLMYYMNCGGRFDLPVNETASISGYEMMCRSHCYALVERYETFGSPTYPNRWLSILGRRSINISSWVAPPAHE